MVSGDLGMVAWRGGSTLVLRRFTPGPGEPGGESGWSRKRSRLDTEDVPKGDVTWPTLSKSKSLPRFCPRPAAGTDEFLSSLPPRVELRSEPAAFFFDDVAIALVDARCRRLSISFFKFFASSLFSSFSLRRRSCGTQSSHLVMSPWRSVSNDQVWKPGTIEKRSARWKPSPNKKESARFKRHPVRPETAPAGNEARRETFEARYKLKEITTKSSQRSGIERRNRSLTYSSILYNEWNTGENFSYRPDRRVSSPEPWLRRVVHGESKGLAHPLHIASDSMGPWAVEFAISSEKFMMEWLSGWGQVWCWRNSKNLEDEVKMKLMRILRHTTISEFWRDLFSIDN